MPDKIKQNKVARLFNAMAAEQGITDIRIPIGTKDEPASKTEQNKAIQQLTLALDKNFIMTNIDNVIRTQLYSDLKSTELTKRDFGFWLDGEQGQEIIYENSISGSSRSGDVAADLNSISDEPENETQILQLSNNYAVDLRENTKIQVWASLSDATSWINKRYDNQRKSIDKHLHQFIRNQIDNYVGYNEIIIDTTGLNDDQIATAFETVIGQEITYLGNHYSNDKNSLNFDNLELPEDMGLILSTKNSVNRKINYLRKVINPDDNLDWGLGHIITKPLAEEHQAIILPKSKFVAGAEYGTLGTAFGYSLIENLKTDYVFYGVVWMESAPSVRITATSNVKKLIKDAEEKKTAFLEMIDKQNKAIDANKDMSHTEKAIAKSQLKTLRKYIESRDLAKVLKSAHTYKFNPEDLVQKVVIHESAEAKSEQLTEKEKALAESLELAEKAKEEFEKALAEIKEKEADAEADKEIAELEAKAAAEAKAKAKKEALKKAKDKEQKAKKGDAK